MKNIFLLMMLFPMHTKCFSQQNEFSSFNKKRQKISYNGLKILGAYSAANIIYGSIAAAQTTGTNKYFQQMNVIWNGVTLSIAGIGYFTAKKEAVLSYAQSLKKQHSAEKLFLFNAGLDLVYIAGGAYTKERSKTASNNPARLKGYGQSVMLQGAVLLLFDGVMYAIHNRHGKKLYDMEKPVQMGFTGNGVGLLVSL